MSEVKPETGWFRTEGGAVIEMDLPVHESIQQRVDRGDIVRVANEAGDPWQGPTEAEPTKKTTRTKSA